MKSSKFMKSLFLILSMILLVSCGGTVTEPYQVGIIEDKQSESETNGYMFNYPNTVKPETVTVVATAPINKQSQSIGGFSYSDVGKAIVLSNGWVIQSYLYSNQKFDPKTHFSFVEKDHQLIVEVYNGEVRLIENLSLRK